MQDIQGGVACILRRPIFFYWYVHFELYEYELLGFNIFMLLYICTFIVELVFKSQKYLFFCLRYNLGYEKYEQDMLNVEETLWK